MLDANELHGIPSGLFGMSNLAKLSLKHNYITGVPSRIAELASLQELYLNNNKIIQNELVARALACAKRGYHQDCMLVHRDHFVFYFQFCQFQFQFHLLLL